MGSYRFIFAFSTSLLIQSITVGFVDRCGGDAAAWRLVAILYAVIGLVVNTISSLSVKELSEEELNEGKTQDNEEKYGLIQAFKLLVKNKYYMMICGTYILQQLYSAMIGAGLFYMTWVLKNKNLFGWFAWAVNIPLIIALIFTPTLVGKWKGMYKLNMRGYMLAVIGRAWSFYRMVPFLNMAIISLVRLVSSGCSWISSRFTQAAYFSSFWSMVMLGAPSRSQ